MKNRKLHYILSCVLFLFRFEKKSRKIYQKILSHTTTSLEIIHRDIYVYMC